MRNRDTGLDTLLDLNGEVIVFDNGYWVKLEAYQLEQPTESVPHGVRYSLTLHDRYNRRIIGFDNAHAIKPPRKARYAGRRKPYDHRHRHISDKGVPYEFSNAGQLLEDFWNEVDRVLKTLEKAKKR